MADQTPQSEMILYQTEDGRSTRRQLVRITYKFDEGNDSRHVSADDT